MRQILHNLFVLALFIFACPCFGQKKSSCFDKFFNQGKAAYDSLKMREAILKFEAALQCPGITENDRDTIQQWKLKIDEQLRAFLKKRDAVNLEKMQAQLGAIDEKINAGKSAAINREYGIALALFREAEKMINDLGKDKNTIPQILFVEKQISYNDSLLRVKTRYNGLILQSDSILNLGGGFIPAYEKLFAAWQMNYDTASAKNEIATLKKKLNNCLVTPCFSKHNKANVYFSYAMMENISGQDDEMKKYIKKGLKSGKMRYIPSADVYSEKIRILSDDYLKTHYKGFFDLYYEQTSLGDIFFNTGSIGIQINAKNMPIDLLDLTVDDDAALAEYIFLDEDGVRFSNMVAIRGGFFVGKNTKSGLEISIMPQILDFKFVTTDTVNYQTANRNITMRNVYFSGDYRSIFQILAQSTYNITLLRKKKLRPIPIIELSPVAGFGFRVASFTPKIQDDIYTTGEDSFLRYFYNKKSSIVPVLKTALYLNFRLFRRFFISLGYRVDSDLKPAKFVVSSSGAYARTEAEIEELHTPIEIIFLNKQIMKGMSVRFLFRL